MIRTFLDSGVLLAAARSVSRDRERALQILEDPNRIFLTSAFVYIEVVPKAIYHKKPLERAFYQEYFDGAEWVRDVEQIVQMARVDAAKHGLAAMDALHLAAANIGHADEFITTERSERPLFRVTSTKVISLFAH